MLKYSKKKHVISVIKYTHLITKIFKVNKVKKIFMQFKPSFILFSKFNFYIFTLMHDSLNYFIYLDFFI